MSDIYVWILLGIICEKIAGKDTINLFSPHWERTLLLLIRRREKQARGLLKL